VRARRLAAAQGTACRGKRRREEVLSNFFSPPERNSGEAPLDFPQEENPISRIEKHAEEIPVIPSSTFLLLSPHMNAVGKKGHARVCLCPVRCAPSQTREYLRHQRR